MGIVMIGGGKRGMKKPVALPSGYTKLAYIESTGTQYIDTEFVANQNTKLEIVTMATSIADTADGTGFIPYGSDVNSQSQAFGLFTWDGQYEANYYNAYQFVGAAEVGRKITITQDKNEFSLISEDGAVNLAHTFAQGSFSTPSTVTLFALHRSNSVIRGCQKIYGCRIYDNDMLIRDFIPCVNADGAIGMYDFVNGKFYGNAGNGVFIGSEVAA